MLNVRTVASICCVSHVNHTRWLVTMLRFSHCNFSFDIFIKWGWLFQWIFCVYEKKEKEADRSEWGMRSEWSLETRIRVSEQARENQSENRKNLKSEDSLRERKKREGKNRRVWKDKERIEISENRMENWNTKTIKMKRDLSRRRLLCPFRTVPLCPSRSTELRFSIESPPAMICVRCDLWFGCTIRIEKTRSLSSQFQLIN